MSLCASREQSHDGPVDGHSLVGLILNREGVRHPDPREKEGFIENNSLLEILPGHFVLLAVEIVCSYGEPAHRMRGIVLDQVVSTVIQLSSHAQVEKTGCVDWQDFEAEGVFLYSFNTELISRRDSVVLVESFGPDTQNIDILLGNQILKNVVPPNLLPRGRQLPLLDTLHLRLKDLPQPLILRRKGETLKQLDLLHASDQLAIHKPIESLYVGGILQDAILVVVDSLQLVFLGFVALSGNKGLAGFHLPIAVSVVQLDLEVGQTELVLLVHEEGPGDQQLEGDVLVDHLVLLEEGVHLLEVPVSEVALSQQVDRGGVVVGQRDQFVREEDGVCVVVHVEVVDGQLVQSPQHLVREDLGGEGVELGEVVLGVGPVVGLEQLREEEDPVSLGGGEDGGLASAHLKLYLNSDIVIGQLQHVRSGGNPQPHANPQECAGHRHRQRRRSHHQVHLHQRTQGIRQRPRPPRAPARHQGQEYRQGSGLPQRPQVHAFEDHQVRDPHRSRQ